MTKHRMAQLSAVLNFVGAVMVFFSFQATSTRVFLVTGKTDKSAAFCIGDAAMFQLGPDGRSVGLGTRCPKADNMQPTAVVNTDSPGWAKFGWSLIGVGFLLQILSMEPSGLSAEDLRTIRKARKLLASD